MNDGGMKIEYEEAYFDMNGGYSDMARRMMKGREKVVERTNDRRKNRVRERGEPNPYLRRTGLDQRGTGKDDESLGCVIVTYFSKCVFSSSLNSLTEFMGKTEITLPAKYCLLCSHGLSCHENEVSDSID